MDVFTFYGIHGVPLEKNYKLHVGQQMFLSTCSREFALHSILAIPADRKIREEEGRSSCLQAGGGPPGRSQRRSLCVCFRLASSGAIISISVLYRSLSLYPGRTLRSDILPWVTYSTQSETAAGSRRTDELFFLGSCLSFGDTVSTATKE